MMIKLMHFNLMSKSVANGTWTNSVI